MFIGGGSDTLGVHYVLSVEVMDLGDSGAVCEAVPDVESSSKFLTANRYNGQPVFCGGSLPPLKHSCFLFNGSNWEELAHLIHSREKHASIQLSEDSFWLLGKRGQLLATM